jgi:hypothetical protein
MNKERNAEMMPISRMATVLMMVGVALEGLQQSEAETDLVRIRNLIMNAQSTLVELRALAQKIDQDLPQKG